MLNLENQTVQTKYIQEECPSERKCSINVNIIAILIYIK